MGVLTYNEIAKKAYEMKKGVEKKYTLVDSKKWSYYFAKALLNPNNDIKKISFSKEKEYVASNISRQITKAQYIDMAKRFVQYVEAKKQLPNYISVANKKMKVRDYTYLFAWALHFLNVKGKYASHVNFTSKVFTRPTEYPNKVYGLWVKYIKTKPKCLDDVCEYILKHFNYLFYFDDKKSNEEVIIDKSGNCTDLLQMLCNMAEAMDYEYQIIHTQCKQSGTGHVYGRFRKKDGSTGWFVRDIACIADESRFCVWCEVPDGGNLLATNPSWFMQNIHR